MTTLTPESWQEVVPAGFLEMWRAQFPGLTAPKVYEAGPLRAILGYEPLDDDDFRWHLSLSTPYRLPTWDELVDAAHQLRPGVAFAVGIPPRSWWINVHEYTLHAWQLRDEPLIAQWRLERRGDRPT